MTLSPALITRIAGTLALSLVAFGAQARREGGLSSRPPPYALRLVLFDIHHELEADASRLFFHLVESNEKDTELCSVLEQLNSFSILVYTVENDDVRPPVADVLNMELEVRAKRDETRTDLMVPIKTLLKLVDRADNPLMHPLGGVQL